METDQQGIAPSFRIHCFPELAAGCGCGDPAVEKYHTFQRIDMGGQNCRSKGIVNAGGNALGHSSAKDIAAVEKEAYEKGFSEGEQAGLMREKQRLEPVIDNFSHALTELERIKKQIYQNVEQKTLKLAMAVARKIVAREVQSNGDVVLQVIRQALEKVVDDEEITVRVNPQDYKTIDRNDRGLHGITDRFDHIRFTPDETVGCGGCLIETKMGNIDARIDQQFKIIDELFELEFQRAETGTE